MISLSEILPFPRDHDSKVARRRDHAPSRDGMSVHSGDDRFRILEKLRVEAGETRQVVDEILLREVEELGNVETEREKVSGTREDETAHRLILLESAETVAQLADGGIVEGVHPPPIKRDDREFGRAVDVYVVHFPPAAAASCGSSAAAFGSGYSTP